MITKSYFLDTVRRGMEDSRLLEQYSRMDSVNFPAFLQRAAEGMVHTMRSLIALEKHPALEESLLAELKELRVELWKHMKEFAAA
jgi:hypothetical protein